MNKNKLFISFLVLLFVVLAISCQKSENTTFDELINGNVISKVEFRSGGNGALYRTEDKTKVGELQRLLNSKSYKQVKPPEPYAGYLYAGEINGELAIGFAMEDLILKAFGKVEQRTV